MIKQIFNFLNIFNQFDPKTKRYLMLLLKILVFGFIIFTFVRSLSIQLKQRRNMPRTKLAVVWASGDPDVAHNVCLMYTHAAKTNEWFDDVKLIVWGPSAKLLSEDAGLQEKIRQMIADGVVLEACVTCANRYGVSEQFRKMGIDVKGMGVPLTDYLQSDWKVLTF